MRKRSTPILVALLGTAVLMLAACGGGEEATATTAVQPTQPPPPTEPPPTEPPPTEAPEMELMGDPIQGGKLYDRWWTVLEVDAPTEDQPLWARQTSNTRSGADTWRCKECHGWDYQGADGAYGSGSHFTGFPGVMGVADEPVEDIFAILRGGSEPDHDFSGVMEDQALADLASFLSEQLIDHSEFIDYDTKAGIGGDIAHGEELFSSVCATCHGPEGLNFNFGDEEEPEYVGTIAADNPWEFIHKVRVGQPGSDPPMPSAIDSGWSMQDVVDVLTYAQTLPTTAAEEAMGSVSRGGRLYDKWWSEAGLDEPTEDMPVWARQDTNTRSGGDTWRCKECHGWDYLGAEGAYGSGSHFTGFPGVLGAQAKSVDELLAMLTGEVDPEHDFSTLGEADLTDMATFLREGLVEISSLIDAETKAAIGGDITHGEELFSSACAACHGADGLTLNFGDEEEPEYVGTIAVDNPWEFIHKVRVGQPGTAMLAAVDAGWSMQDVVDVLTYAQTLPVEAP